ncbi:hypothetical protein AA313_de0209267 [Arthrobotrys entomopaga]|nr:hypothetical protein AA313_de0209267 [Arthrobotrys entomopaga]
MFISTQEQNLALVGENLISIAEYITTHLPSFETECLFPVREATTDLSDPEFYPNANNQGTGMDPETHEWDRTAVDVYKHIDSLVAGILPNPVSLPDDIWTTRQATASPTTLQQAFAGFATAILGSAMNFKHPVQLSDWLFMTTRNETTDRVTLNADGFLEVVAALKVLEDLAWDAVERVESGYHAAQWWVEDNGAGYARLKEPFGWGKAFWVELGNMLMKVNSRLKAIREDAWLGDKPPASHDEALQELQEALNEYVGPEGNPIEATDVVKDWFGDWGEENDDEEEYGIGQYGGEGYGDDANDDEEDEEGEVVIWVKDD